MEEIQPVIIGSNATAYMLARGFYQLCHRRSMVLGNPILVQSRNSRYITPIPTDGLTDDATFVPALERFARRHADRRLLLVPCGDASAELVARHSAELRGMYALASVDGATLHQATDKARFASLCERAGVNTPATLVYGRQDWQHERGGPDWRPLVVKPANTPAWDRTEFAGKRKTYIVNDPADVWPIVDRAYRAGYGHDFVMQPYIPGDDTCLRTVNAYRDAHGQMTMCIAGAVLVEERSQDRYGNYAAIIADDDATLRGPVERLLNALDWHGFANMDVKIDARTHQPLFLEINPRLGGASSYLQVAGANPAVALYRDVIEHASAQVQAEREGLWMTAPWPIIRHLIPETQPAIRERATRLHRQGASMYAATDSTDMPLRRRIDLCRWRLNMARALLRQPR